MAESVVVSRDAQIEIVSLRDEHDIQTVDRVREAITEALVSGRPTLVDLSDVTFMDSSVLGVLVGAMHEAGRRSVDLAITAPSGAFAARVLETSGLTSVLPLATSVDEAKRRLGAGSTAV